MTGIDSIQKDLYSLGSPEKAAFLSRFFKTGKGQYGEGDLFLGITMPEIRSVVTKYAYLSISEWQALLISPYHEIRMASLIGLMKHFQK